LTRLGDVRRNLLGEVDAALDAYREALTLSPSHAKSREAVEALLDHEAARKDAADLLRPLYEADDAHEKLLRVLDIQIDGTDGVDEKLVLLALAADVAEGRLHDATRAFAYAARGTRTSGATSSRISTSRASTTRRRSSSAVTTSARSSRSRRSSRVGARTRISTASSSGGERARGPTPNGAPCT
jgi:tetratricopeptide (TPR) repeat protein